MRMTAAWPPMVIVLWRFGLTGLAREAAGSRRPKNRTGRLLGLGLRATPANGVSRRRAKNGPIHFLSCSLVLLGSKRHI